MDRDLYKLTKIFGDIIVVLILWRHQNETAEKNSRFFSVLAKYLKNGLADFHQTYVIFRQPHIEPFEIKELKIDHSLLPW